MWHLVCVVLPFRMICKLLVKNVGQMCCHFLSLFTCISQFWTYKFWLWNAFALWNLESQTLLIVWNFNWSINFNQGMKLIFTCKICLSMSFCTLTTCIVIYCSDLIDVFYVFHVLLVLVLYYFLLGNLKA